MFDDETDRFLSEDGIAISRPTPPGRTYPEADLHTRRDDWRGRVETDAALGQLLTHTRYRGRGRKRCGPRRCERGDPSSGCRLRDAVRSASLNRAHYLGTAPVEPRRYRRPRGQ